MAHEPAKPQLTHHRDRAQRRRQDDMGPAQQGIPAETILQRGFDRRRAGRPEQHDASGTRTAHRRPGHRGRPRLPTPRRSFGFESTYSGRSRPNIVVRARQLGYGTHAVCIGTEHHSTNIARVRKRVEEGGHDVAQDEIIRRWRASWANLLDTWTHLERTTILDNSGPGPKMILDKRSTNVGIGEDSPPWARAALAHMPRRSRSQHRNT